VTCCGWVGNRPAAPNSAPLPRSNLRPRAARFLRRLSIPDSSEGNAGLAKSEALVLGAALEPFKIHDIRLQGSTASPHRGCRFRLAQGQSVATLPVVVQGRGQMCHRYPSSRASKIPERCRPVPARSASGCLIRPGRAGSDRQQVRGCTANCRIATRHGGAGQEIERVQRAAQAVEMDNRRPASRLCARGIGLVADGRFVLLRALRVA
jgi:hypothetical protein